MKIFARQEKRILPLAVVILIIVVLAGLTGCSEKIEPRKIKIFEKPALVNETAQSPNVTQDSALPGERKNTGRGKPAILVIPSAGGGFPAGADTSFMRDIAGMTEYLLAQNPFVRVVPRERVEKSYGQLGTAVNDALLSKVITAEKIDYYVTCRANRGLPGSRLNMTLYDAHSNASTLAMSLTPDTIDEYIPFLESAVNNIHSALTEDLFQPFPVPRTTFTAFRLFVQGIRAEKHFFKYSASEELYEHSIEEDSSFAQPYFQLVSLYFTRYPENFDVYAGRYIQAATSRQGELTELEKILLSGYRKYYFQKFDEALSSFQSAAQKYPGTMDGYLGQARIYLADGNAESALETVEPVLDIFRENIPLLSIMEEAYRSLGRFAQSRYFIDRIKSSTSDSSLTLMEEAKLFLEWGRKDDAVTVLESLLEKEPDNLTALSLLTGVYFHQMAFPRCIEVAENARAVIAEAESDLRMDMYYKQLLSYLYTGRYASAQKLVSVLRTVADSLSGWQYLSWISQVDVLLEMTSEGAEGNTGDVLPVLQREPYDIILYETLIIASELGSAKEIDHIVEQRVHGLSVRNPFLSTLLTSLTKGMNAWVSGDYTVAAAELTNVLEDEYNPLVAYYVSKSYLESGKIAEAEKQMSRFYETLVLNNALSAFALPKFYLLQAEILEKKNKPAEAAALFKTYLHVWRNADEDFAPARLVRQKTVREAASKM